jgi:hypothetical protein
MSGRTVRVESARARAALTMAEDHAKAIDPDDTALQELAYVVIHSARAVIVAQEETRMALEKWAVDRG